MPNNQKGSGEPAGFKGRRRPLSKPLKKATKPKSAKAPRKMKLEEFYCPGCKGKRVKVPLKNITIKKLSNGREQAVATATVEGKSRKLYKFIGKADAERIKKLKK